MTAQELERDYEDYLEAWPDLLKAGLKPRPKPLTFAEYVVEAVIPDVLRASGAECDCPADWTDGTGWCDNCGLKRTGAL